MIALVACGSKQPAEPAAPPPPPPAHVDRARQEREQHDQLAAEHRKIEEEQQDALAATCDDKAGADKHARCLPSCYATEAGDPRAGKKLAGRVEIAHLVCERDGKYVLADEAGKLSIRRVRGRAPAAHKKTSWQAPIERALAETPKLPPGDAIVVTGKWQHVTHPITKEALRCVKVSYVAKAMRAPLDACGAGGTLACEALGDPASRGINVVHYRLAEAKQLRARGNVDDCQQAALEAIAVARGLPRWRQYAKLNAGKWTHRAAFRTRFDGTLDEDTLFATAAELGKEAEVVYSACGGTTGAPTTTEQEQSFHTCW